MNKIEEFIVEYIQREYTISEEVDILSLNYMEAGYIDSMGLLQFVATLEDEFGIEFTDEELAGCDIKVVGSLAKMIERKMEA